MRKFEIRFPYPFCFVTERMDETQESFDYLREEIRPIAEKYFEFIKLLIPDVKGLGIDYTAFYPEDLASDDVVEWTITIDDMDEEGIRETLEGLRATEYYEVIRLSDKKVLFYGELQDCWKFIGRNYSGYNIDKKRDVKKLNKIIKVEYKESKVAIELKDTGDTHVKDKRIQ